MLAQAAHTSHINALVIDLYADIDTQYYAADYQQIPSLSLHYLIPALAYFEQGYSITQLVYGSGFEQHPESLHYLASRYQLSGNSPATFTRLQNKIDFFATLQRHNIPTPETSFVVPTDTQDWLLKPMRGQGGVGIQHLHTTNLNLHSAPVYWQKYQAGTQHSVLFLADGQTLQIIGFNTQWTIRLSDTEEFIFAGIINHCPIADTHKTQISDWLTTLVPEFQLTGLNSLDFIHTQGNSLVLEINPRPPASMQLYDVNLLYRHIMTASPSKDWQSYSQLSPQSGYTGYQIIYADQDIRIPDGYNWKNGVMDIPAAGAICHTGQPICSIISHHNQAYAVLNALTLKQHIIKRSLYSWNTQPALINSRNP